MNQQETQKAAEVMKRWSEGERVEARLRPHNLWVLLNSSDPPWNWDGCDYRILDFLEPTKGQEWHNPLKFNASKVGVHEGWRLLLKSELMPNPVEYWLDYRPGRWDTVTNTDYFGRKLEDLPKKGGTYRTRAPLPKPEPTPEELEETANQKAWKDFLVHINGLDAFRGEKEALHFGWRAHAAYLKGLK